MTLELPRRIDHLTIVKQQEGKLLRLLERTSERIEKSLRSS